MGAPWSGFFTARPDFKALTRAASSAFRGATQLHAMARDPHAWLQQFAELVPLWQSMGLAAAHDALPGDSFGVVSQDFTSRLQKGIVRAGAVAAPAASQLLGCEVANPAPPLTLCVNATGTPIGGQIELCAPLAALSTAGASVDVTVYNPQGWAREGEVVELLVPTPVGGGLSVLDAADGSETNAAVPCQLSPPPANLKAAVNVVLLTFMPELLPLGLHAFRLTSTSSAGAAGGACHAAVSTPMGASGAELGGEQAPLQMSFGGKGGALTSMRSAHSGAVAVSSTMLTYHSMMNSENAWDFSTDGADGASAHPFAGEGSKRSTVLRGPLFDEVTTVVDAKEGATLRYRLYAGAASAHVFISSGPFDLSDGRSKDCILRFETNISSDRTLLVDSNAMEFMVRKRSQRPYMTGDWNVTSSMGRKEPVSSNYYPMAMASSVPTVGGAGPALSIIASSPQGVASLAPGQLEVMVNRAVLMGNRAGKGNDPKSCDNSTDNHLATMHHVLTLSRSRDAVGSDVGATVRPIAAALANPPMIFAAKAKSKSARCRPKAMMAIPLPPQLELLTLQMLPPNLNVSLIDDLNASHPSPPPQAAVVLLRVRHLFALGDGGADSALGKPVKLDLSTLLQPTWAITKAVECTVDGVVTLADRAKTRLKWKQQGSDSTLKTPKPADRDYEALMVTIAPMEIRTFRVTVQ